MNNFSSWISSTTNILWHNIDLSSNKWLVSVTDYFSKCCQCCLSWEYIDKSAVKCLEPKSRNYWLNQVPWTKACWSFSPNT